MKDKNYYLIYTSNKVGKMGVHCLFKLTRKQVEYLKAHPPIDNNKLMFFEGETGVEAVKRALPFI